MNKEIQKLIVLQMDVEQELTEVVTEIKAMVEATGLLSSTEVKQASASMMNPMGGVMEIAGLFSKLAPLKAAAPLVSKAFGLLMQINKYDKDIRNLMLIDMYKGQAMIKAPCINRFCDETAEFKKGAQKYISNCPNCGTQFYQKKEAKQKVEAYLDKHNPKPELENKTNESQGKNSTQANGNNGGGDMQTQDKKSSSRRLLGRQWLKPKANKQGGSS